MSEHPEKRQKMALFNELDTRSVDVVRCLSADMPTAANSGHPGAPIGCAPLAYVLFSRHMRFNPKDSHWPNRDRFVLSNGHACALQYSLLHLLGYDLTMDDLKKFRSIGSRTPGHPEVNHTDGVEVSTGPLGQGFCNAVGLAVAQEHLAAEFNRDGYELFNNYTYVLMGDGCNQEGITGEAASFAGHQKLGRLIVLYDDNKITIDGETHLSFTEDVVARYEAYGWHTLRVTNGNTDLESIHQAIENAKRVTDRPSFIAVSTIIGFGSLKENTEAVHGAPLKADDIKQLKKKYGLNGDASFDVPEDIARHFTDIGQKAALSHTEWLAKFASYQKTHPDLAAELTRRFAGVLPEGWRKALPTFKPSDSAVATRKLSETVLNALAPVIPELIGGSADLTPSTLTWLKCSKDFQHDNRSGRNFHFGVREHGMAAICNGITAYGGLIPYAATFLNFIGYAFGAVRLSAISQFRVIYVMTHDSIGLGEDGPTHQPVESLAMVRAMPQILLLRPADGNETSGAYAVALENKHRPSVLCLSRQNLPHLAGSSIENVFLGGYQLQQTNPDANPQLIFVASGSEVSLAVEAAKLLKDSVNVRVISMPSFELFQAQSLEYRTGLFPDGVPSLSIEAAAEFGWSKYAHAHVGMKTFGASGPGDKVMDHFGFSATKVVATAQKLLEFYKSGPAPSLTNRPDF